jgi:DNA (cytosine-5)-methyltransferase 1
MRFGSVCSGIEAASVAWEPLGWKAAWLAEIEPFPSAVLAHHYPEVPNLGDMTTLPARIRLGEVEAPDVFCGGTPCQAFSVAGLRRSLDDARGNLSLTFCEIANAIDSVRRSAGMAASIVFWENVPGVLSTKDNAFGCFLAGLAGEDEALVAPGGRWTNAGFVDGPTRAVAWRVLDAQYFGLAQRRKRVFVVASAQDGFDPAAVLFEFDGVRRDSAPSREAGKVAPTIPSCSTAGGGIGTDFDCDGRVIVPPIAETLIASDHKGPGHNRDHNFVAHSLTASRSSTQCPNEDTTLVPVHRDIAPTLTSNYGKQPDSSDTSSGPMLIPTIGGGFDGPVGVTLHGTDGTASVASLTDLSSSLRARIPSGVENSTTTAVMQPVAFTQNSRSEVRQIGGDGQVVGALAADAGAQQQNYIAFHPTQDPISSSDGSTHTMGCGLKGGAATVAVAFPIDTQNMTEGHASGGLGFGQATDPSFTLTKGHSHAVAFGISNQPTPKFAEELSPSLDAKASGGGRMEAVATAMQVRRLTPEECERLQGFPDGYTNIPWRGKSESPDGPRYKALGNSWAVPVVRWIGRRIAAATSSHPSSSQTCAGPRSPAGR